MKYFFNFFQPLKKRKNNSSLLGQTETGSKLNMAGGRQSAPLGVEYGYRVYVFVVYAQRISKRRQVIVAASVEGS